MTDLLLNELPNIGKVLVEELCEIGITTPVELKKMGAERTFIMLNTIDENACFSKLCALEGALQGVRWHNLSPERKEELKEFFKMIKKEKAALL